jgi:ligand-binding sensor domain-containing protein
MKTKYLLTLSWALLLWHQLLGQAPQWTHHLPPGAPDTAWQYQFANTPSGALWVGNELGQLFFYKGEPWLEVEVPHIAQSPILDLAVDAENTLWIGTARAGLFCKKGEQWLQWTQLSSGLSSDTITCIAPAPEGGLWIGYADAGVSLFLEDEWYHLNTQNAPLPELAIHGLVANDEGDIWIATSHYLVHWGAQGWAWHPLAEITGFEEAEARQLRWMDERLWLCTSVGVFGLQNNEWQWLTEPLDEEDIVDVHARADGVRWFCETGYGMHRIDASGNWWSYVGSTLNQIPIEISEMIQDGRGHLWMGTSRGGIMELDDSPLDAWPTVDDAPSEWTIHPNPAGPMVQLSTGNDSQTPDQVRLVSLSGSVLGTWKNQKEIQLSDIPSGQYFFIVTQQGRQQVIPIIRTPD